MFLLLKKSNLPYEKKCSPNESAKIHYSEAIKIRENPRLAKLIRQIRVPFLSFQLQFSPNLVIPRNLLQSSKTLCLFFFVAKKIPSTKWKGLTKVVGVAGLFHEPELRKCCSPKSF